MAAASAVLRKVTAVRYLTPLRNGGSVPGVVEADDLGTYVVKFTGSAQGRKALVAEVVVGELARRLGLRVPELVLVDFDPSVAEEEPHQEVQDLLRSSAGLNLGMDYLPGAADFTPDGLAVAPAESARIIWLDAFTANVDRTVHSANLMTWPASGHQEPACGSSTTVPRSSSITGGTPRRTPSKRPMTSGTTRSVPVAPTWRRRMPNSRTA